MEKIQRVFTFSPLRLRVHQLTRAITDPRSWARAVQSDRRMLAQLEERDFEEGTFGAWLKAALRAEEAEAEAGNVVPIDGPRGG